jgi:hypothetical protein
MEDHNQSWKKPKSEDKERILELSPDMESPDQTKHQIIDLTLEMDSSQDSAGSLSEKEIPEEKTGGTSEPAEGQSPAEALDEKAPHIEDEMNAAIDEPQRQPQEPAEMEAGDELFEELSDITQQVDDAISQLEQGTSDDENRLTDNEPAALDDDALQAGVAELEAAMAGKYDTLPDTTTGAPPNEGDDSPDSGQTPAGDDVIDLVEMVDAAQLPAVEKTSTDDNDIIELIDMVAPDEVSAIDIPEEKNILQDSDVAAITDATIPAQPPEPRDDATRDDVVPEGVSLSDKDALEALTLSDDEMEDELSLSTAALEEALTLSEADEDLDLFEDQDAATAADDAFDPEELDQLFDDGDIAQEETALDDEPGADDLEAALSTAALEEALTLSEADEDLDPFEDQDATIAADDALDPDELDQLFDDDDIAREETTLDDPPQAKDVDMETGHCEEEEIDQQDQVIQLVDILRPSDGQPSAEASTQMDPSPDASATAEGQQDQKDDIDLEVSRNKQIEAAVEHVIRTKYADTIEKLIAIEVEKAVTREIENLKRTLSDDE